MSYRLVLPALSLVAAALGLSGCRGDDPGPSVRLDLGVERSEGRFQDGDRVLVSGPFDGWAAKDFELQPTDDPDVYAVALGPLLERGGAADGDTLRFKFVHRAGDRRPLANEGWESIDARAVPLQRIVERAPTFVFNVDDDAPRTAPLAVRVDMRNQVTLGYFDPARGDSVAVGGTIGAPDVGVGLLDPDGDLVYEGEGTAVFSANTPARVHARIVAPGETELPYGGWEPTGPREVALEPDRADTLAVYFGDARRVLRVVVAPGALPQTEILRVRLDLDGDEFDSAVLTRVSSGELEGAVVVPPSAKAVRWHLVDGAGRALTRPRPVTVPDGGRTVRFRQAAQARR